MAYKEVDISKNIRKIYIFPKNNPKNRRLGYKINKKRKEVTFYPPRWKWSSVKRIYIQGFTDLPPEFSPKGYIKQGVMYYLNKMLSDKGVEILTIAKDGNNQFKKIHTSYVVSINYDSFKRLRTRLARINNDSKFEKTNTVNELFHNIFPRVYPKAKVSPKRRTKQVVANLDENIIPHLEKEHVDKLLDFFETLLSTKYSSAVHRRKLFESAKIKVDDVAIGDIIQDFEQMLSQSHSEGRWGNFLRKNLFLIDSKYVDAIPQLNIVLAGSRKVDFGLIDSQGYLDIFEIKKPSTKLFAPKPDRGNYYWSLEAVKAIVQAEKYLFNAERKAPELTEDIKREKGLNVEVVKPRAVVIIGENKQLDNNKKTNDFRVLRQSLKNIEIVLYDELLQRLKNQKRKIFVE